MREQRDRDKITPNREPTDVQKAVVRGIVAGALFEFIGALGLEFPEIAGQNDRVLACLERWAAQHGISFDQADCRFFDDVVSAIGSKGK